MLICNMSDNSSTNCFGYITCYLSAVEIEQFDIFTNLNYFKFIRRLNSPMLKFYIF